MTLALQGNTTMACSEQELVAAVRRGDDGAFEVLFSRYKRRIIAYVAGMVGDHARAEDITQEVFMSALRRMRATGREIAFKPWIYEIAKNACIDEFRRNRRSPEVSFEEDGAASNVAARHVLVHAPAPHAAIESKQQLDDLCGAFGGLAESHHRVLVLRELEGLSYAEIGERLGMTRAMVESTLFRARRRLSEEYEELASGRRCARVQSLIDSEQRPLTSLGVRDRRQLSRHIARCEPCRRRARIGGLDLEDDPHGPRGRVARIAALLPPTLTLLRWRRGASGDEAAVRSGSHSIALAQSLENVAKLVDPSGPTIAFGRAAAAAAAIALAGAGGGFVASLGPGQAAKPRPAAAVGPPRASTSPRATQLAASSAGLQPPQGAVPGTGSRSPTTVVQPDTNEPTRTGSRGSDRVAPADAGTQTPGGSLGHAAAQSSAPPVDSVSVPGASGVGTGEAPTTSGPSTPSSGPPHAPTAPSAAPRVSAPQPPSVPTGAVQGVRAPIPSAATVQSTVENAQSTFDQAANGAQQQLPSSASVGAPAPPSAG